MPADEIVKLTSDCEPATLPKMLSYTAIFRLACVMADPNPPFDPRGLRGPMVTVNIVNIHAHESSATFITIEAP